MAFDPNDPDTKAALEKAVADATNGLAKKNNELLDELKGFRRGQNVSVSAEELADLKHANEQLKGQLSQYEGELKTSKKQLGDLQKNLEAESAAAQRLMVDGGLAEAMSAARIAAPYQGAVKAMLAGKVQIVTEGDARKAVIDGKPLAEFVTAWAGSDEGKHFVAPASSSGGGAGGSGGGGGKPNGNWAGSREERTAAIAAKFPDLKSA